MTADPSKTEVPGLLFGDLLYDYEPHRQNEADARLVLRMAMTGESVDEVTNNLKKTYGPLMNLNTLIKLMTAKQKKGRVLFYSEMTDGGSQSDAFSSKRKNGLASTSINIGDVLKGPFRFSETITNHLLHKQGPMDYFRVAGRCLDRWFKPRRRKEQICRLFASTSAPNTSSSSEIPFDVGPSVEATEIDMVSITDSVPLEIALRLLMNSKEKYSLVVNKNDRSEEIKDGAVPVFPVKGFELSMETNRGTVTFLPLFLSKAELQKSFTTLRDFVRHLWLVNRIQRRQEICNSFIAAFSSFTGLDSILSNQRPVSRGAAEEAEDDDGDGDPPEMKEFIEELGEATPEFIPNSTPLILGLPLTILLGCVTVASALWKDFCSLMDLAVLSTPLGKTVSDFCVTSIAELEPFVLGLPRKICSKPQSLEKYVHGCQSYNAKADELVGQSDYTEVKAAPPQRNSSSDSGSSSDEGTCRMIIRKRKNDNSTGMKLECLQTLQLLVTGIWQMSHTPRRHIELTMILDRALNSQSLPNFRSLMKEKSDTIINTVIEVDQKSDPFEEAFGSSSSSDKDKQKKALQLRVGFNLSKTFGEEDADDMKIIGPATWLGICLIGNLGAEDPSFRVPSLGFTNVSELEKGISCHVIDTGK